MHSLQGQKGETRTNVAAFETGARLNTSVERSRAAWVALAGMCVAFFMASVDRFDFMFVLEPIRRGLHASDAQMGFLAGLAFVAFNVLFGFSAGRWVDVGARRSILAVSVFAWSVMAILCGAANSVLQMGLGRAGLGLAQAALFPVCMSLIADYFTGMSLHRAVAIFQATPVAMAVIGGPLLAFLTERFGWRLTIVIPAVAGLIVALLIPAMVPEPVRRDSGAVTEVGNRPRLGEVIAALAANRPLVCILLSYSFAMAASGVSVTWLTPLMLRVHGLTMTDLGLVIVVSGVLSIIAALSGGWICSCLVARKNDDRWVAGFCALTCFIGVLMAVAWLTVRPLLPFLAIYVAGQMVLSMNMGPLLALSSDLVRPREQGLTAAVMNGGASVIGFALAPLLTGVLSDRLTPGLGAVEGVRVALIYSLAPCLTLGGAFAVLATWIIRPRQASRA